MGRTFSLGLLCVFLPAFSARAEVVCALGSGASSYDANADQRPTGDAMQLAGRMNAALSSNLLAKVPSDCDIP